MLHHIITDRLMGIGGGINIFNEQTSSLLTDLIKYTAFTGTAYHSFLPSAQRNKPIPMVLTTAVCAPVYVETFEHNNT